jgi:DNA-directed RNA polymerase sigma subunit (sigma70/sigma32)
MANRDDIPKTDPSEIEALIQRLKQSNIEPRDAQLVERLLRLVLSMASLLQHKNASIKRLTKRRKRPFLIVWRWRASIYGIPVFM